MIHVFDSELLMKSYGLIIRQVHRPMVNGWQTCYNDSACVSMF